MSIELMLLAVNINSWRSHAFRRSGGAGLRDVRADRGRGGSGHRPRDPGVYFRNRGSIAVEDVNMMKG